MKQRWMVVPLLMICAVFTQAQSALPDAGLLTQSQFFSKRSPHVSVVPIGTIVARRGGKAPLDIALEVNRGFHINSHTPRGEFLIPTMVHLDPPDGIAILGVSYPEGTLMTLPFAGSDKMSIYTGSFHVTAEVRVTRFAPLGRQRVHGYVRYQACDNRQCFPPKTTPLAFDVKVARDSHPSRHSYTPESPHIR